MSLAIALALGAPGAWAHGTIPGINQFYNGLLHPLVAPAHLLSLLALALLAGQQTHRKLAHEMIGLAVGLLVGVLGAGWTGDPDTDRVLWLAAVVTGLLVALGRELPAWLRLGVGGLIGCAVGLASADVSLRGSARISALIGAMLGALILVGELSVLVEAALKRWHHPALRIGVRVLASWLTACALLMGVLALKRAM
ncbi:MAG: HupE/UreJ family protein [Leptothrix sp. (in: b-proteobacteria)]